MERIIAERIFGPVISMIYLIWIIWNSSRNDEPIERNLISIPIYQIITLILIVVDFSSHGEWIRHTIVLQAHDAGFLIYFSCIRHMIMRFVEKGRLPNPDVDITTPNAIMIASVLVSVICEFGEYHLLSKLE